MVSNDHIETAKAVAIKAGILMPYELEEPNTVLTGEEFASMVGETEDYHCYDGEDGVIQAL